MKTIGLVHIGRFTFLTVSPRETILNNQCNSTIFVNPKSANLKIDVFNYFGVKYAVITDKLDRRTKKFKQLEKDYQYFSVSFLPEIKRLTERKSFINHKFN